MGTESRPEGERGTSGDHQRRRQRSQLFISLCAYRERILSNLLAEFRTAAGDRADASRWRLQEDDVACGSGKILRSGTCWVRGTGFSCDHARRLREPATRLDCWSIALEPANAHDFQWDHAGSSIRLQTALYLAMERHCGAVGWAANLLGRLCRRRGPPSCFMDATTRR